MHLLLPSISLSGTSLTAAAGIAPSKADLVRLQVAALQALREFIMYRCANWSATEPMDVRPFVSSCLRDHSCPADVGVLFGTFCQLGMYELGVQDLKAWLPICGWCSYVCLEGLDGQIWLALAFHVIGGKDISCLAVAAYMLPRSPRGKLLSVSWTCY